MHNCFSQGFGDGRIAIKSEDFFLKGRMFIKDFNKSILKIGEINCIITFKILVYICLK